MNAERIGYLTAKLLQSWSMGMVPLMDEDIDDLLSILDDYEKAKAESSLYLERSIEMGFKVKDLMAELEKAKAEREEFQEQYAQLESSCYDNGFPTGGSVFSELEKAEAELARYAPLVEAVKQAKHLSDCAKRVEFLVTKFKHGYEGAPEELAILRAALACREPEREKKEGSLTLENATEVAEKTARELNNSRVVTDDQLKKRVTI